MQIACGAKRTNSINRFANGKYDVPRVSWIIPWLVGQAKQSFPSQIIGREMNTMTQIQKIFLEGTPAPIRSYSNVYFELISRLRSNESVHISACNCFPNGEILLGEVRRPQLLLSVFLFCARKFPTSLGCSLDHLLSCVPLVNAALLQRFGNSERYPEVLAFRVSDFFVFGLKSEEAVIHEAATSDRDDRRWQSKSFRTITD